MPIISYQVSLEFLNLVDKYSKLKGVPQDVVLLEMLTATKAVPLHFATPAVLETVPPSATLPHYPLAQPTQRSARSASTYVGRRVGYDYHGGKKVAATRREQLISAVKGLVAENGWTTAHAIRIAVVPNSMSTLTNDLNILCYKGELVRKRQGGVYLYTLPPDVKPTPDESTLEEKADAEGNV
jgi:hypothetical protein